MTTQHRAQRAVRQVLREQGFTDAALASATRLASSTIAWWTGTDPRAMTLDQLRACIGVADDPVSVAAAALDDLGLVVARRPPDAECGGTTAQQGLRVGMALVGDYARALDLAEADGKLDATEKEALAVEADELAEHFRRVSVSLRAGAGPRVVGAR